MPTLTADGVSIAYQETGTGTPLVFCHEFAGSMDSWRLQVGFFSRRYRTIAYNARGYAPSEVPADAALYEQDHQVATLLGVLDALGIKKAHVCGLSMGAHTVLNFALAHPDRCLSVVAAGAGTGSADPVLFRKESEERAELLEKGGMTAMDSYLSGSTRIRFRHKDPNGWEEFARLFMAHDAQGSANTLRGFQGRRPTLYTREEAFRTLQVPVLVVAGDEDDPCLEPGLFLKRVIPACGLALIPQTGHACNIEEPAAFNAVVAEFLAQVEAGRWLPRPQGSGDSWALPGR
jgi:pimeloyl-ACP methyl ester carboxylesterase